MDFLKDLLNNVEIQDAILTILGSVVLFFVSRASAAFTLATGLKATQDTQDMIAKAITTGVLSAFANGLEDGTDTFKAHVIAHLKNGNPERFAQLSPLPDALDNLISRYTIEAIGKFGKPK